jgi:hypothetical protein
MTNDVIPINPTSRAILATLADRTGRPATELLDAAVEALRRSLSTTAPVAEIPDVNPSDVWEADAQADAGHLTPHADVFAKLHGRQ